MRVQETVEEIERHEGTPTSIGLALDICREDEIERMARQALEMFGQIDILIACAGTLRGVRGWPRQLVDLSAEEWDEVLNINLKGVFLSNRAVLPTMIRQRRGNIINVSSTSGLKGLAYDSAYSASKFGVIGLSEAVAEEVRQFGVRVQVLLPGAVDTPMWRQGDAIPHLDRALPGERIADIILYMLTLPEDTVLSGVSITPLQVLERNLGRPYRNYGRSSP
jgi:NAD(P)-dependent dehydrogenase (short-subunit alcohol dehydrogenase family)